MWHKTISTMAVCVLVSPFAHADSMRCGRWVVTESMTPAEIVGKCGAPTSKDVKTEDVWVRTAAGGTVKSGVSTTETWTYSGGGGSIPMRVVIVDGEVRRIESAP